MSFPEYFSVFQKLSSEDQELLNQSAFFRTVKAGTLVYGGEEDCMGLLVLRSGQLRAHITSDEGKEITVYRLFERDICLFSASCVMNSIQFDIMITAEKDTEFWVVPPYIFKKVMERSAPFANYTNQIMATRFTDVMWLIEQVLWKSFDKRLAHFLLEESAIEDSASLKITHELIANHLGTAREVVTRMLKYFQTEGMVKLTRGTIELTDVDKLEQLQP
jgi:CRP/FNR family transcriptional regulator